MSAASEDGLDDELSYRWPIPPQEGWTADDLDRIPGLPPHTELIDGNLVFASPQTAFRGRCMRLLENSPLEQAPDHLDVMREMTIKLDTRNRPEPDVLVFPVEANTGPRQTWYRPEDIVLAVEVVSTESRVRDRPGPILRVVFRGADFSPGPPLLQDDRQSCSPIWQTGLSSGPRIEIRSEHLDRPAPATPAAAAAAAALGPATRLRLSEPRPRSARWSGPVRGRSGGCLSAARRLPSAR